MNKTFRIVKIISEQKVVVNAGSNDGIHEDDCLEVYEPGQEVIDPETKENLGCLDFVKAKLLVKDVFPKMCVCVNREIETMNLLNPMESITAATSIRPLPIDSKDISGGFEGMSRKIKVGDLVREKC